MINDFNCTLCCFHPGTVDQCQTSQTCSFCDRLRCRTDVGFFHQSNDIITQVCLIRHACVGFCTRSGLFGSEIVDVSGVSGIELLDL